MKFFIIKSISLLTIVSGINQLGTNQLFAQSALNTDVTDFPNTICNISWYKDTSISKIRDYTLTLRQQGGIKDVICNEKNGDTPLFYAILGSDTIEKLQTFILFLRLDNEDSILQRNNWGGTPLSIAHSRFQLAQIAFDNQASSSFFKQYIMPLPTFTELMLAFKINSLINSYACRADDTLCKKEVKVTRNTNPPPLNSTSSSSENPDAALADKDFTWDINYIVASLFFSPGGRELITLMEAMGYTANDIDFVIFNIEGGRVIEEGGVQQQRLLSDGRSIISAINRIVSFLFSPEGKRHLANLMGAIDYSPAKIEALTTANITFLDNSSEVLSSFLLREIDTLQGAIEVEVDDNTATPEDTATEAGFLGAVRSTGSRKRE